LKVTVPPHVAGGAVHVKLHVAPVAQVGAQLIQEPLAPHAAGAVPTWHVPPLQQPPLQGEDVLQAVEHVPALQASFAGQSDADKQPQRPATQWLVPVPEHGAHDWPFVPHTESLSVVTHVPVVSQQPPAQFAEVHLSTHCLLVHACAWPQVLHEVPPDPHADVDSSVWHWLSVPQQPPAHVEGPHGEGPVSTPLSVPPSGPASGLGSGLASGNTPASPPSGETLASLPSGNAPASPPSGSTLASPPSGRTAASPPSGSPPASPPSCSVVTSPPPS
jgi:hypothetical protein